MYRARIFTSSAASAFFLAAMAVYADPAIPVKGAESASPAPVETVDEKPLPASDHVRVLDTGDSSTTQPAVVEATTQPVGNSVTAEQVTVSDAGTVEIHVNDGNLVQVLRLLSTQSQRNIVASKEVQGTVTANLYDVTVREALDAILKSNGFGYREQGNFVYVYSAKELADMDKADRKLSSEVFRLFYTPAANVQNLVKPVLSAEGQVAFTQAAASGIATGTGDVGGDSHADSDALVVTDYPENLDKVRTLIKEIDRRPEQILIEATILRAALNNDNSLGVDFNFMGGVDFQNFTTNSGQISNANVVDPAGTGVQPTNASGTVSSVGTGNNFTNGTNGFRVGVLTNNLSVFVNALETITNTTVLANPKILALNKQRGEVIVGRKDGYYTTTVTQTATVQSVDFLETGTRLVFRPYIGDDGFIRMEVHPEDSSGGLNASNLPFKVTTEATSNVLVKDGHTVVIGGLFRESNSTSAQQVPFFGSLPLAGYLFRKQEDTSVREEIIILLTPHIIKDQTQFSADSQRLLKQADKMRVGVRQGMMPFSQTRLAEISYDQARAEMDKPNPDRKKALFFLNCSTNLDPIFPEAINLKESITGQEIIATDHSMTRDFITRQILADRAMHATTQPAERSAPLQSFRQPTTQPIATALAPRPTTRPAAVAEAAPTTAPTVAEIVPTTQPTVTELPTDDEFEED